MLSQLIIGTLMLAAAVLFQAMAFELILNQVQRLTKSGLRNIIRFWKAVVITIVALAVAVTLIIEIWMWGFFYFFLGVVPDFESALYFSTSAFTTVGFGDIVLSKDWRLLSSMESLHGFLLFGWSTAFIFEVVSHVYRKEGKALNTK